MDKNDISQMLNETEKNFEKYIKNPANFKDLKSMAYNCEIDSTKCRWSLWRVFLKAFPLGNETEIRKVVKAARDYYKQKLNEFQNPQKFEDPLSMRNEVSKNMMLEDIQLKNLIQQDIDRTRQSTEMFQEPDIKQILINILFVWAKLNPVPSYRQGMNELVAVLAWVCIQESVSVSNAKECDTDLYKFLNNRAESEADIFTVFSKLMAVGQKDMFDNSFAAKNNPTLVELMKPKQKILNLVISSAQTDPSKPPEAILARMLMIQECWLEHCDEELYRHFRKLRIAPQTFSLRWIRCLLSREHPLSDTAVLWDAIFAYYCFENPKATLFEMLDYLILAMQIQIRDDLLSHDDEDYCVQRLLKYQNSEDLRTLIDLALVCKDYLTEGKTNGGGVVQSRKDVALVQPSLLNSTQSPTTKDLSISESTDNNQQPVFLNSSTNGQPFLLSNQQKAIDRINEVIASLEEEIIKNKSEKLQNSVQRLQIAVKLLQECNSPEKLELETSAKS